MAVLNIVNLDLYIDKSIDNICPIGFGAIGDSHNHCAHFVSHVLKLNSNAITGTTCATMGYGCKFPEAGAIIRVNDIYNSCEKISEPDPFGCLVYYTLKSNIDIDGVMGSLKNKHVGICIDGYVYHYGNKKDAVRKNMIDDLKEIYGKDTIMRYTKLPTLATFLTPDDVKALVTQK